MSIYSPKPFPDEMKPVTEHEKAFSTWSKDQTPENASALLTHMEPIIGSAINRYAGKDDPLIRGRARRMALDAVRTYDPNRGAKLSTHVTNHLQGLRRASRQQSQVLKVPERAAMEQAYLQRVEAELTENLGREPSTIELADYSAMPTHKIARLRKYVPGAVESSLPEDMGGANRFDSMDRELRMAEMLHSELNERDQKILEWSLGLHGSRQLSNQEIASRCRITPGAVSQRKALLQKKLDDMNQFMSPQ